MQADGAHDVQQSGLLLGVLVQRDLSSLTVLLVCCLLVLQIVSYVQRYRSLRHVPGPWYLSFSDAILTYHEFKGTRTTWIHSLHERYGTVVRVSPAEISFADVDALRPIYGVGSRVKKDEFYGVYAAYGETNMFATIDAQPHAEKRRAVAHTYSRTVLGQDAITRRTFEKVRRVCEILREGGRVDLYLLLTFYTLDNISALVYGERHGAQTLHGSHVNQARVVNELKSWSYNLVRLLRKGGYHWQSKVAGAVSGANAIGHRTIHHLSSVREAPAGDLDDYISEAALASMADEQDRQSLVSKLLDRALSAETIMSEARDHVIAGSDTTTNVLAYLLHELMLNDRVRLKLRESLSHLSTEDDVPNDLKQIDKCEYLEAVIKEALRLWAAIPMTLPRVATEEMLICGHLVPAGTKIGMQCYTLHRNKTAYPRPEVFDPSRWENPTKDAMSHFWAFSSGSRSCIGQNFAMIEMKWLVAALVRLDLARSDFTEGDMHMTESVVSFTMTPRKKEMFVRLAS